MFGSGLAAGRLNDLTIVSPGNVPANTVPLRTSDRAPYLLLEVSVEYSVIQIVDVPVQQRFQAVVTMYMYAVNDLTGRELFAYHFHPSGLSPIKTPHLHWSAATPIALPLRPGSSAVFELDMSRAHFPTHHLELPELIRLLIRDFGVGPRRRNWEQILERS